MAGLIDEIEDKETLEKISEEIERAKKRWT